MIVYVPNIHVYSCSQYASEHIPSVFVIIFKR